MSAHEGKSVTCHGPLDEEAETHEGLTLSFEEHGRYVRSPPRETGFESGGLRFDCPECGRTIWACPVCSDQLLEEPEGRTHQAPGWFYGESTGDAIPCHNCNQQEVAAQRRRGY